MDKQKDRHRSIIGDKLINKYNENDKINITEKLIFFGVLTSPKTGYVGESKREQNFQLIGEGRLNPNTIKLLQNYY